MLARREELRLEPEPVIDANQEATPTWALTGDRNHLQTTHRTKWWPGLAVAATARVVAASHSWSEEVP